MLYQNILKLKYYSKYKLCMVVNHSALQVQSLILRHECLMYVLT
ncbi:hypothetical protein [Candidatus Tisiphia endosymbiont of Parasteatoda lunata]